MKDRESSPPVATATGTSWRKRPGEAMRQLKYVLFFAAAVGVAMALSRRGSGPPEGTPAKDFVLPIAETGASFHLADQRGTPVLLEVFASWCPTCRHNAPTMDEIARTRRSHQVRFVGISVDDTIERARAVKRAWGIPYDVLFDSGSFSKAYDIKLLPTYVMVDGSGRIRHVATGGQSRDVIEGWLAEVGASRL